MNITITQDNSRVEVLGSNGASIIKKLYELAIDPNNTLTLRGNISTNSAYGDEVDYLNQHYGPDFIVSATNRYIRFQDSEVFNVLKSNNIGDGTGITQQIAASVSSLGTMFKDNTNITSFNELAHFTNVTTLSYSGAYYSPQGAFQGCTNLTSIDLSNVKRIGGSSFWGCTNLSYIGNCVPDDLTSDGDARAAYVFKDCQSLQSINLSNCDFIPAQSFENCYSLSNVGDLSRIKTIGLKGFSNCTSLEIDVVLPSLIPESEGNAYRYGGTLKGGAFYNTGIKSIQNLGRIEKIDGSFYSGGNFHCGAFGNCSSLRYAILPSTLNFLGECVFANDTALEYVKIEATVPPTLDQPDNTDKFAFRNTTCIIYVPDASVNAYKTADGWSNISGRIKSINDFATDFPNG